MTRKGPGLLVRDLVRFEDPVLIETLSRIAAIKPDIAALQSFDFDHDHVTIALVQDRLKELGHNMPHRFAVMPNAGVPTGFDLNRDGRLDTASDRQGYGTFAGHGGIVLLSRFPIVMEDSRDMSQLLWKDLPDPQLPKGYFTQAELDVFRLHGVAAWDVPVKLPEGVIHVLAAQASSPVFDGPEDRNGLRNAAQLRFWASYIDQLEQPFVLLGGLNNDPEDGEGLKPALHALLDHERLQDPKPRSLGPLSGGIEPEDTVDWGPEIGSLRVDYVLPSAGFGIAGAAVERKGLSTGQGGDGTPHEPVWVDVFWK